MKKRVFSVVVLIVGAILFQNFQCASPEMTSGKLAIRQKEYAKAEKYFNKEVSKNPKNSQAYFFLAKAQLELEKYAKAADNIEIAEKKITDPQFKRQIIITKYKLWADCFNTAVPALNKYYTTEDKAHLDTAIKYFDIAIRVRPQMSEFYRLKGSAYESAGNKEKAIETYKEYQNQIKTEIEFAKSANIFIDLPREKALEKFGEPAKTKGGNFYGDSSLIDHFSVLGQQIYLFSGKDKDSEQFLVKGWRVNPPNNWMPGEREYWTKIDIGPLAYLTDVYYTKKEYEKAIEYAKLITKIDPTNVQANRFLVNLYIESGKEKFAVEEMKRLVERNPDNKYYLSQYGDILFALEKYDKAIDKYKKALEIDPDFCDAQRNLAATYKNKAVQVIQKEQDKADANEDYEENPDKYLSILETSAKYFQKARSCEKYKNDLTVLGELANIYIGTKQQEKLNQVLDDLERLEPIIPEEQKEKYWLQLCKIYGALKIKDKQKALKIRDKQKKACNKAKSLMK